MKRLILMRHAKSSWSDENLPDIDRPLNAEGATAAQSMGAWLSAKGYAPDQAITSTAARCVATLENLEPSLKPAPATLAIAGLYGAEPAEILEILRANCAGDCVLVVGHQPGIGELAREMRIDPPPHHPSYLKYPTGTATVLEVPVSDWSELSLGSATLIEQASPRELA